MVALLLGQRAGQLDVDRGVKIAVGLRLADDRHPVAFQAEDLPDCVVSGTFKPDRAGHGRDLRLSAQHGGRDGHGDLVWRSSPARSKTA